MADTMRLGSGLGLPATLDINDASRRIANLEAEIAAVQTQMNAEANAVYAKHNARVESLKRDLQAVWTAVGAATTHPCEGTRVWRTQRKQVSHGKYEDRRQIGVVAVIRDYPGALSGLKIGDVIVRRQNPRTGRAILAWHHLTPEWQLEENE